MKNFLLYLSLLFLLYSCKKETVINKEELLLLPDQFGTPVYNLSTNKITQEGFDLGKRLFYDPLLSINNTISCGNCHQQFAAFAHADHDLSHGVEDRLGTRNSIALQNLIWKREFMWDGGIFDLDLVPINAIESHVEMDNTFDTIINRLNAKPDYVQQFKNVFGNRSISEITILQALSQFQACLVSANSRYDDYISGKTDALNDMEKQGLQLFRTNCSSCHKEPFFTDETYRNNGNNLSDIGREAITLNPTDKGKFKVPSLRNIEYTAPYFHRGNKTNLQAVLNHYTDGIIDSPTLDPLLKKDGTVGISLTADEKTQIIAFLKTLTDHKFLDDRRFAEF